LSNATISGTPTEANTFNVVITVTDSQSPAAQKSVAYAITIAGPPPTIDSTSSPQEGAINLPYSFAFRVSDGLYPFTWSETGALPPGISLATDGTLTGTPTATGSFPITVRVSDSLDRSATPQNVTIGIAAHGFKATGAMATGRASHTATLLQDGRVLVAGGLAQILFADFTYYVYTATAELYDPNAGTFSTTGSMGSAHHCHTATLLTNGQVLITDGTDASSELFDPASGTFSPTGSIGTARGCSYTATLLPNGKVLVAGGEDSDTAVALDTAELYDLASGTFSPTGSMGTARVAHAASLLTSGKVLVSGGANGAAISTAELYNTASGTFSSTGDMTTAREGHTATLLTNGKILITGGSDVSTLSTAEIFDPASGTFTATGTMAQQRSAYTATLLADGTVLVAGGSAPNGGLSSAELFDPATGLFSVTGSMITGHAAHTATLLNDGTVLVVGGSGRSLFHQNQITSRSTAELYQ
jgi:WD40 repeat protein